MARTSISRLEPEPAAGSADAPRYALFLGGNGLRAETLEGGVRAALAVVAPDADLRIVDAWAQRDETERYGIRIVPTLVRTHPSPHLRWVGDLGDSEALLRAMRA